MLGESLSWSRSLLLLLRRNVVGLLRALIESRIAVWGLGTRRRHIREASWALGTRRIGVNAQSIEATLNLLHLGLLGVRGRRREWFRRLREWAGLVLLVGFDVMDFAEQLVGGLHRHSTEIGYEVSTCLVTRDVAF